MRDKSCFAIRNTLPIILKLLPSLKLRQVESFPEQHSVPLDQLYMPPCSSRTMPAAAAGGLDLI